MSSSLSVPLKQCYQSTGQLAPSDIPCDPTAATSACCSPGSICAQNLYCKTATGLSLPGTCTDQQWGVRSDPNPNCPCRVYYKNSGNGTTATATASYSDGITVCADGSVCCGVGNWGCCESKKGGRRIVFGNDKVVPGDPAAYAGYYAGLKVATLSASAGGPASTGTEKTDVGYGSAGVMTGVPWAARVGVGVGLGVAGALLLAALVWLFVAWRRYLRARRAVEVEGRKGLEEG